MTLTRFRWVFCQLETLRQCIPQSVRRTLNELPESLDETYERMMIGIKKTNQVYAYRMLQCLSVAVRPLSVAELAELLAFDFDVAKGGIPKLTSDWRWEDHEQLEAVLSTCSSLIAVVPGPESPVVQSSHFSVKEFLMSDRLATSTRDISQYHISLEDAHTVLAQACLGVLLRDPDVKNDADSGPLSRYAAEHWATHAQVENVASWVRDGLENLFDPDKPYFEAWVQFRAVDGLNPLTEVISDSEPAARPLYYAAWCGFHELVEHLAFKNPQCVSARGGHHGTALHAASSAGHLKVVRSLLQHGVGVDVQGVMDCTPLRSASQQGHRDVVQCLLDHGADVNPKEDDYSTPLHWAAYYGHVDVVRVLLKHNADVHSKDDKGWTPLHDTTRNSDFKSDLLQVVRLLLEHGANANARNNEHMTPLHTFSIGGSDLEVARILLEHGADIDAEDKKGRTPWQLAVEMNEQEIARLLSEFRSGRTEMQRHEFVR